MIRTALEFIKKELDAYIAGRENDAGSYGVGNIVDVNTVVLPSGSPGLDNNKHITLMLAGLEEERREGKRPYLQPTDNNNFVSLHPPVELQLFVLCIAHSADYPTALRDLGSVLAFFQANPVFDEQKFPALNAQVADPAAKPWQLIERLSFRLYNLSFEQQNNLWSMLGSKYIPSVLYKASMISIFDTRGQDKITPVNALGIIEN